MPETLAALPPFACGIPNLRYEYCVKEETRMQLFRGGLIVAFVCALMLPGTPVRGAHATNFLEALQTEVSNRVATATNLAPRERRTLVSVRRVLNRRTHTLSGDTALLASAASMLNARFTNDAVFASIEEDTAEAYSVEAHARFDALSSLVGTSNVPASVSRLMARAQSALARADAASNSVPVQARALSSALARIRTAGIRARRLIKAPPSIENAAITLYEDQIVNDRTVFYLHPGGDYNVHNPEELGLWTYQRTGLRTGVVTLTSNYPYGTYEQRPLHLVFRSPTRGTFTGTTVEGDGVDGTFEVVP
jgi:hypothetical protein